jgi:hypothetical protein
MVANCPSQACFNAWINCEEMLKQLAEARIRFSIKVTKVIDECALICMGTFHAIKSRSVNTGRMALLCVGICEECAELCETLPEPYFRDCARICRECAETMSLLAFTDPG